MKRPRTAAAAAALLLFLPLSGCVFAVGVGGDEEDQEKLRDRLRAMERRLDRLEHGGHRVPATGGAFHDVPAAEASPPAAAPEQDR